MGVVLLSRDVRLACRKHVRAVYNIYTDNTNGSIQDVKSIKEANLWCILHLSYIV